MHPKAMPKASAKVLLGLKEDEATLRLQLELVPRIAAAVAGREAGHEERLAGEPSVKLSLESCLKSSFRSYNTLLTAYCKPNPVLARALRAPPRH